jgi:putative membrane protein
VLIIAVVLAALASLLHVYIWWLESYAWTGAARKVFGTTAEQAEQTRELAYNQGFYNLFLAIGTAVGVALVDGHREAGVALIVFGVGSMLAAALVLATADLSKSRAAVVQGLCPLVSLVLLLVWAL